ncbi:hypothetical protein Tco_1237420 [Tanacetum coccineum]
MTLEDELRYTKSYVPTISNENYIPDILKPIIRNLECRSIHEGRPVSPESTKYDNIQNLFQIIKLLNIFELHEEICPRFLLEFYSSIEITKDDDQNVFLTFWALKRTFKFSLESFASILSIPCEGECSYSDESSLDSLKTNQESNTPYQTHILTPNEIIQSITTTGQTIFPNKILKEELRHDMRSWNEIIQENAFGTQNDSPFLLASSCHMITISDQTIANLKAQLVGNEVVRVKIPKCMSWLAYDEPIGDLDMMKDEVDNPSPQSTLQVLPSFKMSHEIYYHDYDEREYENKTHEEGHKLCGIETRELTVCQIKRYKMIKYSFNDEEEYVVVKEDEYNDLTITSEEACRAYQEIFQIMDEGWMVTHIEGEVEENSNLKTSL